MAAGNITGGTRAPGGPPVRAGKVPTPGKAPQRVAAAVHTLGGPRYWSPKLGRMATVQEVQKANAAGQRKAPARSTHNIKGVGSRVAHTPGRTFQPEKPWYEQSPQEVTKSVTKMFAPIRGAELAPFRNRAQEIERTAPQAENRLQNFGNQLLGNYDALKQSAEGSAKTFENQIAENTLQTSKEIETAGQNANTATAGYLNPQVKQQQEAEKQLVQGVGNAAAAGFGSRLAGEQNFLTNARAAAAGRIQEGQTQLAGKYAKMQSENQAKEQALAGRVGGEEAKEVAKLIQAGTSTRVALNKLGLTAAGLQGKEAQNIRNNATRNINNIRTTTTSAGNNQRSNATKITTTGMNNATSRADTAARVAASISNNERSVAARYAAIAAKGGAPGGISKSEQKVLAELSNAQTLYESAKTLGGGKLNPNQLRIAIQTGKIQGSDAKGKKVTLSVGRGVSNGVVSRAIEEIMTSRYLSRTTRTALERFIKTPPEGWSNFLLGKPAAPNQFAGVTGSKNAGVGPKK